MTRVVSAYSVKYQGKYVVPGESFEMDPDDAKAAIDRKKVRLVSGGEIASGGDEGGERSLADMTMTELKVRAKEIGLDPGAVKGTGSGGNVLVADVRKAIEEYVAAEDEVEDEDEVDPDDDLPLKNPSAVE